MVSSHLLNSHHYLSPICLIPSNIYQQHPSNIYFQLPSNPSATLITPPNTLDPSLGNIGACEYLTAAVKCCLSFFTAYQDQLTLAGGGAIGAIGSPGGSSGLTSSGFTSSGSAGLGSPSPGAPISSSGSGLQFARVTMCVDVRCMYYLLGLYGRTSDQGKVVQGLLGMGCMFSIGSFSSPSPSTTSITSTASSSSSSSTGRQHNTAPSHNHHHNSNHNHNNSSLLSLCQKEYLQVTQELEFVHSLQSVWSGRKVDMVNTRKDSNGDGGGSIATRTPQHNKENTSENKSKPSTTPANHIIIKPSQSQSQQSQSLTATDLLHRFIFTSQQLLLHGDDGNDRILISTFGHPPLSARNDVPCTDTPITPSNTPITHTFLYHTHFPL